VVLVRVLGLESIVCDDISVWSSSSSSLSSSTVSTLTSSSSFPIATPAPTPIPLYKDAKSLPWGIKAIRALYPHRSEWYQLYQLRYDRSVGASIAKQYRYGGKGLKGRNIDKLLQLFKNTSDFDLHMIRTVLCGSDGIGKSSLVTLFCQGKNVK
jgi:hypothetical protein